MTFENTNDHNVENLFVSSNKKRFKKTINDHDVENLFISSINKRFKKIINDQSIENLFVSTFKNQFKKTTQKEKKKTLDVVRLSSFIKSLIRYNKKNNKKIKALRKSNIMKQIYDTLYYRVYVSDYDDEEDRIEKKDAMYRFTFAIYDDIYLIIMFQVIT